MVNTKTSLEDEEWELEEALSLVEESLRRRKPKSANPTKPPKTSRTILTAFGRTQTVAEWAAETGISYFTINLRRYRGWSPEAAVETPVGKRRRFMELEGPLKAGRKGVWKMESE